MAATSAGSELAAAARVLVAGLSERCGISAGHCGLRTGRTWPVCTGQRRSLLKGPDGPTWTPGPFQEQQDVPALSHWHSIESRTGTAGASPISGKRIIELFVLEGRQRRVRRRLS